MATLVLQSVGTAIGGLFGGPIGATLGRAAGAAFGYNIDRKLLSKDQIMKVATLVDTFYSVCQPKEYFRWIVKP
jgi:hypothetical protein